MSVAPLVSVVIPVYNGAGFINESIGSIVAQSFRNLEIVIVDDGSRDISPALIEDWARRDERIRTIFPAHRGPEHARNVGVEAARGDFIAHLDQDDIAAPSRLQTQLDWLEARELDVCGSCTMVFGDARYFRWVPERQEDIRREYVFRPAMIHSTTLVAAAVAKAHPFREDITCGGEELLMRLTLSHRVGNVQKPLVKYRRHDSQRYRRVLKRWRRDTAEARRRFFFAMFPDATAADHAVLMCVATPRPFGDDRQRQRAAAWMRRLSDTSDPMLRRLMADRWAACQPVTA